MANVNNLIQFVESNDIPLGEETKKALDGLQNPHYSVAVVGPFQAGKSTLMNRVFLGEEILLKQGDGRCTTAVMTKVVYGPEKRLTVFYRNPAEEPKVYLGEAISPDLIASLTVVDDADENERQRKRLELAQKVEYIQLEYPCESIKQFSFYDTPGIDDPNEELIDLTTIQFLKDTDLVILVVDAAKTLDLYTKRFLVRSVFNEGHKSVLLLGSVKSDKLKSEDQDKILGYIRNELNEIGREYIPVMGYTFDQVADGSLLSGAAEIRSAITEYIEKNKEQARLDRLTWLFKNDIVKEIERLKAVLLVNSKNEEEIARLREKIDEIAQALDTEYINTLNGFQAQYLKVKEWLKDEIERTCLNEEDPQSLISIFLSNFAGCNSLSSIKAQIDHSVEDIGPKFDYTFATIAESCLQKVEDILKSVTEIAACVAMRIKISPPRADGLDVSTGWGGKIHPYILRGIEIAGTATLTSNIYSAVVIAIIQLVPKLRNCLPSTWIQLLAFRNVKSTFVNSVRSAERNISSQLGSQEAAIKDGIQKVFEDIYNSKIAPYIEQIDNGVEQLPEDAIKEIDEKIEGYTVFVNSIS